MDGQGVEGATTDSQRAALPDTQNLLYRRPQKRLVCFIVLRKVGYGSL